MTGGARSLPGIPRRRRTSCAMPSAAGEIVRLEERRLAALEERTDADLAVGRHSDLVGDLETLVAEHPLRERLRAQLMLALYRSRRQAEALEVYQETRHALVERLGIDPSPELQQLGESLGAAAFANRWSSRSSSRIASACKYCPNGEPPRADEIGPARER